MTFTQITNRVYFLTQSDSNRFPIADLTASINVALERVASLINSADFRWQWDDTNQTDLPIATTTITSGQQDYAINTAHLTIDRVEIKSSAGKWSLLKPIDQHDKSDYALDTTTTGLPTEYDKVGNSLFLYSIPNYTQTASLKVYFTRAPVAFLTSDLTPGTITPGFNPIFHDLVPLYVSYDYAIANNLPNANQILNQIQTKELELTNFYGQRSRDERPRFEINLDNSNR